MDETVRRALADYKAASAKVARYESRATRDSDEGDLLDVCDGWQKYADLQHDAIMAADRLAHVIETTQQ
jgi:hypothetical protein